MLTFMDVVVVVLHQPDFGQYGAMAYWSRTIRSIDQPVTFGEHTSTQGTNVALLVKSRYVPFRLI